MLKRKNQFKQDKLSPMTSILFVVLCLYVLARVVLFIWAFMTACKDDLMDYPVNKTGFPKDFYLFKNIGEVYRLGKMKPSDIEYDLIKMFGNSFLYAFGCAFARASVTCLMAYLAARYAYKISSLIYTIVIVTMIVPIVGSLPSEIEIAHALNIYNEIWGMWIMRANFLGMYFLVFYEFFKSLPRSYTEAAEIDGAGDMTIMLKIAFPLVLYTYLSVFLIYFIEYWNDYQIPKALMPYKPTIAYAMFCYANASGVNGLTNAPYVMTMALLVLIPILTIFLCFHKRLLGNLNIGGIKG